jgi:hypothetical protein
MRNEPWLKDVKTPQDLVKNYGEMVKYQGRSIALPGKDAKPEEWNKVFEKFRPEKAEAYEMPHDNWPKDVPYSAEFENAARQKFHELGIAPVQAKALYEWYVGQNLEAIKGLGTRYEAPMADLEKEWGANSAKEFDIAQKALSFLVDGNKEHPLIKWLDSTGENKNPVLIKFFNDLGKKLGEDTLRGEESIVSTQDELQEIDKKIAEMRSDPKGAYQDPNHPGHKIAVAEMKKLYDQKIAAATGATT